MKPYATLPFFFPSTIALIDDSATFLSSMGLQLDMDIAFKLFSSPAVALTEINNRPKIDFLERCLSSYQHRGESSTTRHVVDLEIDLIQRQVQNNKRFELTTVVVVDYHMPEMNGLEFCLALDNPCIKKILLTGKADERIAIEAFNAGIIDRFFRKQDSLSLPKELNQAIRDLQKEYFSDVQTSLSDLLATGSHVFLSDPCFGAALAQIQSELNIVEHYLTCAPDGLLMLDQSANSYLLIVQTEEMLQAQYEMARDQNAPEALLQLLLSREAIPHFSATQGVYSPQYAEADLWRQELYPATQCRGETLYYYALVKQPLVPNLQSVLAYDDYLNRLDHEKN